MNSILELYNVVKKYHNHTAVDNVSCTIPMGSIFGLLGPNGAGKTSLIRIVTKITGADEGEIILDGQKLEDILPAKIGYLPEERGLYKKMKVGEQLMYLAQLKGLSGKDAKDNLKNWFQRFEIVDWWGKQVQELSKGMQQKIQFIATVVHHPKLIILDEPFSGLDPINTNLIKEEIHRLNREGTSIIFSTHRMEQVEEMCTDIVLINQGKNILQGKVTEIKESYKENVFEVKYKGKLSSLSAYENINILKENDQKIVFKTNENVSSNALLSTLIKQGIEIQSFQEILPSLNEIFIKQVEGNSNE